MAAKVCTPFCSDRRPCVKHHDLLVALLNCADNRSSVRHSTDQLESTVVRYINSGWSKDDDIDDPVELYRFPLVHWASVLGKVTALEWMIHNGFQATVHSKSKETAMHRCIMCLYRTGIRRPEIKMARIAELLKDCLALKDDDGDTPLHLAAKRLVRGSKQDYFGQALRVMIQQAGVMPGRTGQIIDSLDKEGNTVAHIIAQNDICVSTARQLLETGTDLTIKNMADQTALDVAINSGSRRIAKAMNDHTLKGQTPQQPYDSCTFTTDSPPESDYETSELEPASPNPETPTADSPNPASLDPASTNPTSPNPASPNPASPGPASPGPASPGPASPGPASPGPTSPGPTSPGPTSPNPPSPSRASENEIDDVPTEEMEAGVSESSGETCELPEVSCDATEEPSVMPQEELTLIPPDEIKKENHCAECPSCRGLCAHEHERTHEAENSQISSQDSSQNSQEASSAPSTSTGMDSSLLNFLRGAGLLENVTKLANDTRQEDENLLKDKLRAVHAMNDKIVKIDDEIAKKKRKIDQLNVDMEELATRKETVHGERKRLNEECSELQSKLHCCDSLLRYVPKTKKIAK